MCAYLEYIYGVLMFTVKKLVFVYNYIDVFYRDLHPVITLDPVEKINSLKHLKLSYRILTLVKLRKIIM